MDEGKFKKAFDERELAQEVEPFEAENIIEEPQEIEDMAKLSLDIKELEASIKKAEYLQGKFGNDPTKKAAYDLIQDDYLKDKQVELAAKKKKLEELEKKNGFQVVEDA
jgi:hypothetical protein